jgi:hypothetical protein
MDDNSVKLEVKDRYNDLQGDQSPKKGHVLMHKKSFILWYLTDAAAHLVLSRKNISGVTAGFLGGCR